MELSSYSDRKYNILIVDDIPDNLRLLSGILEEGNYDVRPVTSGRYALKTIEKHLPDLILLDIRMPGMDGYELCRQLKSDQKTREIPVIFISAVHEMADKVKAFETGAVDYIAKPFHRDEILVRVQTQMTIRQSQKQILHLNEKLEERVRHRTSELEISNKHLRHEIEERKRIEAELTESEQHFRFLFEHAPDLYILIGADGTILDCSLAVEKISNVHRDQLIGKNAFSVDLPFKHDREFAKAALENIWSRNEQVSVEHSVELEDGTNLFFEVTSYVVTMKGEQRILLIVRDITQRKTEEQKRKQLEGLLFQAQKMESIGTLAGGIAHDFNNILGAIFGYTQMAQKRATEGSKLEKYLDQIFKASMRAKDLIRQILTLSHQNTYQKFPCDISIPVEEALTLIRASLPSTIDIRRHVGNDLDCVLANQTAIHQVVMNLCTNAYHAIDENGGTIEVELTSTHLNSSEALAFGGLKPGRFLRLTIKDSGCGMDEKTISQVFDPYFTTKNPEMGTGLGLSTVHTIVREHSGGIRIESQPGRGTAVSVVLPFISEIMAEPELSENDIPKGSERILFVDDEIPLAKVNKDMLTSLGYKVDMRIDPKVALAAFQKAPYDYDLVITDMTMPGLTGLKLAESITKIRPELPLILCSGFVPPRLNENKGTARIDKILTKPLSLKDLAVTIRDVLDGK